MINPYLLPGFIVNKSKIEEVIINYFNLEQDALQLDTRKRIIVFPRQIAMWLMHNESVEKYKQQGWSEIGRYFNKDHATAIHAVKTINDLMSVKSYKNIINEIQVQIYGKVKY